MQVISEVRERLSSFDSELKDARRGTEDVQKVLGCQTIPPRFVGKQNKSHCNVLIGPLFNYALIS